MFNNWTCWSLNSWLVVIRRLQYLLFTHQDSSCHYISTKYCLSKFFLHLLLLFRPYSGTCALSAVHFPFILNCILLERINSWVEFPCCVFKVLLLDMLVVKSTWHLRWSWRKKTSSTILFHTRGCVVTSLHRLVVEYYSTFCLYLSVTHVFCRVEIKSR